MRDFLTVSAESVDSCAKDFEDCKQVGSGFFFGTETDLVECHDLTAAALDERFNERDAKSRKTVSAGNHKLDAFSAVGAFQYGVERPPLVVESVSNVGNDFGVGVTLTHEGDLSVDVRLLLDARDSAVTDNACRTGLAKARDNRVSPLSALNSYCLDSSFI